MNDNPVTKEGIGAEAQDYRTFLDANGLKGARLGEARDYFGSHEGTDAIIAPTDGTSAWMIDPIVGDKILGGCSSPAALAGYPHITVPAGYVHGLPVGLSFFAGAYQEGNLIRYAYAFERASRVRRPPRFAATVEA